MAAFGPPRIVHIAALATVAVLFVGHPAFADRDSTPEAVNISATVSGGIAPPANPSVELQGLASPSAAVTVTRDGAVVASAQAGSSAAFDVVLTDQPLGPVSYLISAVDTTSADHAPITVALTLTAGSNTVVSGIFLGPTIGVVPGSTDLGNILTLFGQTAPASGVTISIGTHEYRSTAASSGAWTQKVLTDDLGAGTFTASAVAQLGSVVSAASRTVTFGVNAVERCDGKNPADFNCDGRVDFVDFSIILYFWQGRNVNNARADVNHDGDVNVVDFSIMLFQWTG